MPYGFRGSPSGRDDQGGQAMAKLHNPYHHEVFQEDPMIVELLEELHVIEEKGRVEARFYALLA
jgi:hypothetical protein